MSDIDRKRAFVADLYPHRGWQKKVNSMPDAQVLAIYLREQNKAKPSTENTENSNDEGSDKIPF